MLSFHLFHMSSYNRIYVYIVEYPEHFSTEKKIGNNIMCVMHATMRIRCLFSAAGIQYIFDVHIIIIDQNIQ